MGETVHIRGRGDERDLYLTEKKVIEGLLDLLRHGRTDECVDIYTRCDRDLSAPLIASTSTPDESAEVANVLFRANDFGNAARLCEALDDLEKAAMLFARAQDAPNAARLFETTGDVERAAEMLERAGAYASAADKYVEVGDHARAAACFANAGAPLEAGRAYLQIGRADLAVALLQEIGADQPEYEAATAALADAYRALGADAHVEALSDAAPTERETAPRSDVVAMLEGFDELRALPLFRELSLKNLRRVHAVSEARTLDEGTFLLLEGEPAPGMWVVLSGEVAVRNGTKELAKFSSGDHVGEMSLVDGGPASADVVAVNGPVRALHIERLGFEKLLKTHDELALGITRMLLREMCDRLRTTSKLIAARDF